MLHTKFIENCPPVSKKKILKGFYHIYRRGGHLGHVNEEDPIKNKGVTVFTSLYIDFSDARG